MPRIKLDDIEYNSEDLSDGAKAQLLSLQFVDAQIRRLKNEVSISETARQAYIAAVKREIEQSGILPIPSSQQADD
jgi:hypothetical protein